MITLTTTIQEITLQAYSFGLYNYLFERQHNPMSRDEIFNLFEDWGKEFEACHGENFDWEMNPYYDEIDDFVMYKFDSIKADDKGLVAGAYIKYAGGIFKIISNVSKENITRGIEVEEILPCEGNEDWIITKIGVGEFDTIEVVDPDYFGIIMDTSQGHDKELVKAINKAWMEDPTTFKHILIALYTRDIEEIADSDAWDFEKILDLKGVCGNHEEELDEILAYLKINWNVEADNYLMHIADDADLDCILRFMR